MDLRVPMAIADIAHYLGVPRFEVALVRRYPNQEVRRLPFEFEDRLGRYLDAQPEVFQIPASAPPEQPRFGFKSRRRSLIVSNVSTQLTMEFLSPPKDGLISVIEKACVEMDRTDDIFQNQERYYTGIVMTAMYSSGLEHIGEIVKELANSTLRFVPDNPTILNAAITTEWKGVLRTIELAQFLTMSKIPEVDQVGIVRLHVDFEFDAPGETGLQVKVDVNNRPLRDRPSKNGFQNLLPVFTEFAREDTQVYVGDLIRKIL
jgi:hypothetical protein